MKAKPFESSLSYPGYCGWIFFFYALGLWLYCVPFTGDEKVYVSTALEMWIQKSWLYPILFGEHSYFKPPFLYWATLVSWKIFGFGNFGTYLPSITALTGTAWLIGGIQKLLNRKPQMAAAGIWFAGCFGTLTYGTTAQMEIWIVFFYTAVWWSVLKFLNSKKWRWLYLGLSLAGISSLVKSPLYSVFSVLSFWIYLLIQKKWALLKKFQFYLAHFVGISLGSIWYLFILSSDRDRFWNHYISGETLSKLGGNGSTALRMWLDFSTFTVPFLLILIFVFGLFFFNIFKLLPDLKSTFQKEKNSFLFSAVVLPALFFSYFPYRTETYLYIILPFLTLWMDESILDHLRSGNFATVWTIKINGLLILTFALLASFILVLGRIIMPLLGVLLIVAGVTFFYFSWKLEWKKIALASLFLVTVVRLGAVGLGESDVFGLKEVVKKLPTRGLSFYDEGRNIWNESGVLSAAVGKISNRLYSPQEAITALKEGQILVLNDAQKDQLIPFIQTQFSGSSRLNIQSWKRWKRGFLVPSVHDLFQLSNKNSDDWETKNRKEYKILWLN